MARRISITKDGSRPARHLKQKYRPASGIPVSVVYTADGRKRHPYNVLFEEVPLILNHITPNDIKYEIISLNYSQYAGEERDIKTGILFDGKIQCDISKCQTLSHQEALRAIQWAIQDFTDRFRAVHKHPRIKVQSQHFSEIDAVQRLWPERILEKHSVDAGRYDGVRVNYVDVGVPLHMGIDLARVGEDSIIGFSSISPRGTGEISFHTTPEAVNYQIQQSEGCSWSMDDTARLFESADGFGALAEPFRRLAAAAALGLSIKPEPTPQAEPSLPTLFCHEFSFILYGASSVQFLYV